MMALYVFDNEALKMTSKILADSEDAARELLPPGIEWTLRKEGEGDHDG